MKLLSVLTRSLKQGLWFLVPLTLVGLVIPSLANSYVVGSVVFLFFVYSTLALSYDILGGFTGYMNLGHAVFFGIGAYVTAILFVKMNLPLAFGLLAVPAVVAGFAFLFSFPLFRLKGFYFAVAGLAFVQLAELLVASSSAKPLTNGFNGIAFVQSNIAASYYAALAVTICSVIVLLLISNSRLGLILRSIKEDEEVAESVGINVARMKRMALIISAAIAGLDGSIYFWGRGAISPDTGFGFTIAFIPVTLALLGGTGTVVGPVLGGLIYTYLQNYFLSYLSSAIPGTLYFPNAITGVILIVVGLFLPRGIAGSASTRSLVRRLVKEMTR